jgi:uncharacterized protein YjdB
MCTVDMYELSLDSIKNLSIDEIINLYRQGYTLQGIDNHMNHENIKSLSPCTTQAALFQKNGSTSFNCTATITDTVDVDVVVTFDASYSGVPVWCKVSLQTPNYPAGTYTDFYSPTFNIVTGTQDIIINIPISIYGTGTYKIIAAHIVIENGAFICDIYNSGASCQSITVTGVTPPPFTTINISPIATSIQVGQTQQLTAICKNSIGNTISCPSLLWTSDNTSVATVSQTGLVTGLVGGHAGITANYSGIQSNFSDITVTEVTLTAITISPASATIGINGTSQLTTVCKDQTGKVMTCPPLLTWSSDNNSIATVDGLTGLVVGVSAGTANITAKVGTIVSNKAVITVSAAAPSLTTITISPTSATIGINGTSQLKAVCKDQNGKEMTCPSLIWDSDSIYVATVTEFTGLVIGASVGIANITARYGTIVSDTAVITVSTAPPSGGGGLAIIGLISIALAFMITK